MRTVLSVALFFLAGCAALVSASSSDDEGSVATPEYATSLRASNEKASRQQLPFSAGGIFAHRGSYYGQVKGEEDLLGDFFEEEVDDDKGRAGESSKPGWIYVSRAERGIVQLMCVHTVLTPQAQLIRHGEKFKDSDKSGLSAKGTMRAKCLVDVFGKHGRTPVDYIIAQDFKPTGQRKRPFDTVLPIAKSLSIPIDHSCDRDDTRCAASVIRAVSRRGLDVVVVWEHARLTNIAQRLGVTGLHYPSKRYDVVFKIRRSKVHGIYSEECPGLDDAWMRWRGRRKGRHGKGGKGGRLVDDESWADRPEEDAL